MSTTSSSGRPGVPPGERARNLLLRGDNVLKSHNPERFERSLEAYLEARAVAADDSVDERVRDLVERRIEETQRLIRERSA